MKTRANRFRVIGGQWRGRLLGFPDGEGLRPTGDRVRETLFNWLQRDIIDARCLDAYTGSGALAIEALSRGAASVLCLDTATHAVRALQANAQQLGSTGLDLRQQSALDFLARRHAEPPFDLIFLDPPFALNLLQQSLDLISTQGWLQAGGRVYLESSSRLEALQLPQGWALLKSKRAGQVYFGLAGPQD